MTSGGAVMLPSGPMITPVPPSPTLPELDVEPPDEPPDEPPLPLEVPLLLGEPPLLPDPPPLLLVPELPPLPDEPELVLPWFPCVLPLDEQPRTTVSDTKAAIVVIFMVKLDSLTGARCGRCGGCRQSLTRGATRSTRCFGSSGLS